MFSFNMSSVIKKTANSALQALISIALLWGMPASAVEVSCSPSSQKYIASGRYDLVPINVTNIVVQNELAFDWSPSGNLGGKKYVGKKLGVLFVPDLADGGERFESGDAISLGNGEIWQSKDGGASQLTGAYKAKGVKIPDGIHRIYVATGICDVNKEFKFLKWRLLQNSDGTPLRVGKSGSVFSSKGVRVTAPDGNNHDFVKISWSGSEAVEHASIRYQDQSEEKILSPIPVTSMPDAVQSVFSGSFGGHYKKGEYNVIFFHSTNPAASKGNRISLELKLANKTVISSEGNIQQTSSFSRMLEFYGGKIPFPSGGALNALAFAYLVNGGGLDDDRQLIKSLKEQLPGNNWTSTGISTAFKTANSLALRLNPLTFNSSDVALATPLFNRVDLSLGFTDNAPAIGDQYLVSWSQNINLNYVELGENQKKNLRQLPSCENTGCINASLISSEQQGNAAILTSELLERILRDGLWVSVNPEYEINLRSSLAKRNKSSTLYEVVLYSYSSNNTAQKLKKFVGFSDDRVGLAEAIVSKSIEQSPGKLPYPKYYLSTLSGGWRSLEHYVLSANNSHQFKVLETGLGANGPPSIEGVDYAWENEPTSYLDIEALGSQNKNQFHALATDEEEFETQSDYIGFVGLSRRDDPQNVRQIVPVQFQYSDHIDHLFVRTQTESGIDKSILKIVGAFERYNREKGRYADVFDYSKWNLGSVYMAEGKIVFSKASQYAGDDYRWLDLLVALNGIPATSAVESAIRTPLKYSSIQFFGLSDPNQLPSEVQLKVKSEVGTFLDQIEWENTQEREKLGLIGVVDPKILQAKRIHWQHALSPSGLCGLTPGSTEFQCNSLQFLQDNNAEIQAAAKEIGIFVGSWAASEGTFGASDIVMASYDLSQGQYISAGFGYAGALPLVPNGRLLGKIGDASLEAAEVAKKFGKAFTEAAEKLGKLDHGQIRKAVEAARDESSLWWKTPFERGKALENELWATFGNKPPNIAGNYPGIDDFNRITGVATSMKSIDVTCYSPKSMERKVIRYLSQLADWKPPRKWGEVQPIDISDVKSRQLLLVFEKGALSDRHLKVLNDLIDGHPGAIVVEFF